MPSAELQLCCCLEQVITRESDQSEASSRDPDQSEAQDDNRKAETWAHAECRR